MWIYIAVSVSLFVAFTNFIVLALICGVRRLQTLRNVPLAGLATADILVGLFWIPIATASSYYPENKGLCRAALSCEILTMHASLFNLIAVSTERWIAIFKPLRYHQIASKTVVVSSIAMSWVLSFVMLIAFLLADKHEDDVTECDIVKYIDIWLLYLILIIFYIVCGIMILMQLKVYFIVREQLRKIRPTATPGNVTNGLIAATSFIIEKSFKIDETSADNENDANGNGKLTNLSIRQSNACALETPKCEGAPKTEEAKTRGGQDESRSKILKCENTMKLKRKKLEFSTEQFEGREKRPTETMELCLPDDIESNTKQLTKAVKICIENEKRSSKEQQILLHRLELNKSFTSDSTDAEIETKYAASLKGVSGQSSRRHADGIENGADELEAQQHDVDSKETRKQSRKMSSRKQAYYSPGQESLRQKVPGNKKSFASFVRMFSVIKRQRKLEFARAAATNVVCLCFVLMWAPKSTIDLLTGLGYCDRCSLAHSISAVLAWMNSGINALIYAWRMHEFREAIRAVLFGKRKHVINRRIKRK